MPPPSSTRRNHRIKATGICYPLPHSTRDRQQPVVLGEQPEWQAGGQIRSGDHELPCFPRDPRQVGVVLVRVIHPDIGVRPSVDGADLSGITAWRQAKTNNPRTSAFDHSVAVVGPSDTLDKRV